MKSDLELLKHAFFTDPNDQSPWNYHEWLISLLTPVQVVALLYDTSNTTLEVGFSTKVKNVANLNINLVDENGSPISFTVSPKANRNISSTWLIKIDPNQVHPLMTLQIK